MTTNLLALAQHKLYLQSRIALLVQKHADYKAKESETPESDHKLALNSSAACIWDAKCEMEAALDNLGIAEQKAYPFTPLSCTLYEYSGPCMKIQLPDGTKVDISLPDGKHGSFFEQLDKLLTAGTSMVFGYNAEYRDAAEKKKGATFQMHYPKEPTSFSKEMEDQVIQEFKKDEANVFDLLANAIRPVIDEFNPPKLSAELSEATNKIVEARIGKATQIPTHTDAEKPGFDLVNDFNAMLVAEDMKNRNRTTPVIISREIHEIFDAAIKAGPNTPTDVSKAIAETAKQSFIVEPDESNSNIGHDD